jgi:hypothetical protein
VCSIPPKKLIFLKKFFFNFFLKILKNFVLRRFILLVKFDNDHQIFEEGAKTDPIKLLSPPPNCLWFFCSMLV